MKRKTPGSALRRSQQAHEENAQLFAVQKKAVEQPAASQISAQPTQPRLTPENNPESDLKLQIQRLQQRQMAYLEETTRELEFLQKKVSEVGIVEELRAKIAQLENENAFLATQIQRRERAVQFAADNLGELARILAESDTTPTQPRYNAPAPAQETAVLFVEPEPVMQVPVATWEEVVEKPVFTDITPSPEQVDHQQEEEILHTAPVEAFIPEITTETVQAGKPKKAKKKIRFKKLILRTVALGLVVFGGSRVAGMFNQYGDVAGVDTQSQAPVSGEPVFETYEESFAELPFAATDWAVHTDTDFGISLDYPKNTSNKVRTPGGSNLWFLRRNGYILKITRFSSTQTLEDWWKAQKPTFNTDNQKESRTSFKGEPAILFESSVKTNVSGTSYFVKRGDAVYQFWVKDEPAATDDGQRIQRMVESLKLSEPVTSPE